MTQAKPTERLTKACERCDGQGWYFVVPEGFNPFLAGGFSTARAMRRVGCPRCSPASRAALEQTP